VIAMMPIATRPAGLTAFGRRKAGTPLEIASTPVSAVQPDENARSTRSDKATPVSPTCSGLMSYPALSATGGFPSDACNPPTAIITMTPAMNRYVGTAKVRPDSRTPRRFIAISTTMNSRLIPTRCAFSPGTAEMMLSTPAATNTATVIT
jgi:hypothetical protein